MNWIIWISVISISFVLLTITLGTIYTPFPFGSWKELKKCEEQIKKIKERK